MHIIVLRTWHTNSHTHHMIRIVHAICTESGTVQRNVFGLEFICEMHFVVSTLNFTTIYRAQAYIVYKYLYTQQTKYELFLNKEISNKFIVHLATIPMGTSLSSLYDAICGFNEWIFFIKNCIHYSIFHNIHLELIFFYLRIWAIWTATHCKHCWYYSLDSRTYHNLLTKKGSLLSTGCFES